MTRSSRRRQRWLCSSIQHHVHRIRAGGGLNIDADQPVPDTGVASANQGHVAAKHRGRRSCGITPTGHIEGHDFPGLSRATEDRRLELAGPLRVARQPRTGEHHGGQRADGEMGAAHATRARAGPAARQPARKCRPQGFPAGRVVCPYQCASSQLLGRGSRSAGIPRASAISRSADWIIRAFRGPVRRSCFCAAVSASRSGSTNSYPIP